MAIGLVAARGFVVVIVSTSVLGAGTWTVSVVVLLSTVAVSAVGSKNRTNNFNKIFSRSLDKITFYDSMVHHHIVAFLAISISCGLHSPLWMIFLGQVFVIQSAEVHISLAALGQRRHTCGHTRLAFARFASALAREFSGTRLRTNRVWPRIVCTSGR